MKLLKTISKILLGIICATTPFWVSDFTLSIIGGVLILEGALNLYFYKRGNKKSEDRYEL